MNSFFRKCFWVICSVGVIIAFMGCGASSEAGDGTGETESVGSVTQHLDAARARVVQEASFAMTGNYTGYTTTNWPTGTVLATSNYTLTDLGAWNSLINSSNYSGFGYTGFFVSCMRYRTEHYLPSPYTVCQLSNPPSYTMGAGSFEMPYYTCQGTCPSAKMHGGQCKPFMNLVAYRSGQYHGAGNSFKALPTDSQISGGSPDMPLATYANILEGDLLRKPSGHAAIVVRKVDSLHVIIFDSNWVAGGDGDEVVGSHSLGFTGAGTNFDLGAYRVLKCVYLGTC